MRLVAAICLALCLSTYASAKQIKFVAKGTGQGIGPASPLGTIGGIPFNGSFTISAVGDTDNINPGLPITLETSFAEITIDALNTTYQFADPVAAAVSMHLFRLGPFNTIGTEIIGWDLGSPVASTPTIGQVDSAQGGYPTSGGLLKFAHLPIAGSFVVATLIPEPSAILLAAGLVLIGACRRH